MRPGRYGGLLGPPFQPFLGQGARCRNVERYQAAKLAEVGTRLVACNAHYWDTQATADDLGDISERYALVADAVQTRACWRRFQCQSEETCRIQFVHGWPPVGPVVDVGRDALLSRYIDKRGNEAVVVGRAVYGRRDSDSR